MRSKYVIHPQRLFDVNNEVGTNLCYLLKFYGVEHLRLPSRTGIGSDSEDEQAGDEEEFSVVEGIIFNQTACLEELALRLGLKFDRIQVEVEQMEHFKQHLSLSGKCCKHDGDSADGRESATKKCRHGSVIPMTSPSSKASVALSFDGDVSHISESLRLSPTQPISSQE